MRPLVFAEAHLVPLHLLTRSAELTATGEPDERATRTQQPKTE